VLRLTASVVFPRLGTEYEIAIELRDMDLVIDEPVGHHRVSSSDSKQALREDEQGRGIGMEPFMHSLLPMPDLGLPTVETEISSVESLRRW
jgi:hypothetical protein